MIGMVWEHYRVGGSKKLIMLALADWADDDGGRIYPSVPSIAIKVGDISPRHVRRLLGELVSEGYLEVVRRGGDGGPKDTTDYRMVAEQLVVGEGFTPDTQTPDTSVTPDIEDTLPRTSETLTPDIAVSANPLGTVKENRHPFAPTRRKRRSEPEPAKVWGKGSIRLCVESWQWQGITDEDRRLWAEAYPAVDLDRQLAAAAVWCRDNPAKGRKSQYGRFLGAWLSRSQDKGGDRGANNQKPAGAISGGLGDRWANQQGEAG